MSALYEVWGTKYPGDISAIKPNKRFKNTNCPFPLVVNIEENAQSADFYSTINIEWESQEPIEKHAKTKVLNQSKITNVSKFNYE